MPKKLFQPPVEKTPWEGVLDGTIDGPTCIQLNQFNESTVVGSEDCLILNVYTTQLPGTGNDRLKPVLVYIHGGRWLVGTANSKLYPPFYLIDQDIVVVNIQYRLGAFGFLRYMLYVVFLLVPILPLTKIYAKSTVDN